MLKRSKYNIEVYTNKNGDKLLFNGYTTALGIMNKDTQKIYNNIEKLEDNLNNDGRVQRDINILKENGFLVDENIDEYERINLIQRLQRYSTKELKLTIAPTMNCNMACPYCYEEKNNSKISEDTLIKLIDFIKNYLLENGVKTLTTKWYGGEPLIALDTIKKLSKELIKICDENNIKYTSSIVTNGILLDKATAKTLKNLCNVSSVQITIDGTKNVHNKRRILKSKGNSFEIITNNIETIKELLKVIIRINIDKENLHDIPNLIDYLIDERSWGDKVNIYFYPIVKQTDACKANISNCFTQDEFGMVHKQLLNIIHNKKNNSFIDDMYPRKAYTSCAAICANSLVIDPEGNFYTCWDLVGVKNRSIGNVYDGIVVNEEYLKWLTLDTPSQCKKCNHLPICGSGCPFSRLQNGNKPICGFQKISLNELLKLTYEESYI
ncbi:radical SAM/SPASM domain-containing protein [Clostridium rectalis]|uniref:radical SAM/SPASM domain-containing protein n=1 Tax=Clostridium rectalis TaxID=2040295 RepID=UPI000F63A11D|nr:radical SAM protein [Clostridium rectalis]